MKTTIKILLLAVLFVLAGNSVQAQTTWTPLDTVSNVMLSYFEEPDCLGVPTVYLKVENSNTTPVSVTWSLWTTSVPKTVELIASETLEGYCSESSMLILTDIPAGESTSSMTPVISIQ